MLRSLFIVASTFAGSAGLTWAVMRVAQRRGWMAEPRPDRLHATPTALFGGIAIYLALVGGLLLFAPITWQLAGLLALTTAMFALGLADDAWDVRPQSKLVVQIAGGLLLYLLDFHFNESFPWLLDLAIVVFWVVAITNAMNLLDNMNGLCAGAAVIATAFRWLFYYQDGNAVGAVHSAVFLGAVLGFLVFNFPRASVFMGDTGSMVIGFFLAALNLTSEESYSKGLLSVLFFPVLVLALPIFDTAFVSLVRTVSGRAVSHGGRDHTSHRLVAVGLSETAAVLIFYAISIASGITAFLLYRVGFSYAWFLGALLVLGLILFGIFLASVKVYPEDQVPWDSAARPRAGFSLAADFRYKRVVLWVVADTLTILVAWYAAFLARYGETTAWPEHMALFAQSAPVAVTCVLLGLFGRGLYRTDWQHFSLHEIRAILSGATLGLGAAFVVLLLAGHAVGSRAGLGGVALGAAVLMLAGNRLFVRALADALLKHPSNAERLLVYGAGKGGALALRELRSNAALAKVAIGFVDDDPVRHGMTLHGLRVLGGLDDLDVLLRTHHVDGIVVSTRKLTPDREARLRTIADARDVRVYHLQIGLVELAGGPDPNAAPPVELAAGGAVMPHHHLPGSAA